MSTYNDIGIKGELDWPRIKKLMVISVIAGFMVLIGDMLLGWGVHDTSVSGLEGFLSAYLEISESRIFWSAFLGFIGISLEGLCFFAVYRLIVPYSKKYAHLYRTGIFGYLMFAACGVHVPCLACVYVYKHLHEVAPDQALDLSLRFGLYFLLPAMILFFIFWAIHSYAHIASFAKGFTPYPRWCWIFCMPVGQALTMLLKFLPETALRNAITAAWLSIGNIWMMAGLLAMMGKAKTNCAGKKDDLKEDRRNLSC